MGIAKVCGKLLGEAMELLASTGAAVKHTVSATTGYARDLLAPQPVALSDSPRPAGALAGIPAAETTALPEVSVEGRTAGGKRVAMEAEQTAGELQRGPDEAEPAPTARGEAKAAQRQTLGDAMPQSEADGSAPQRPERQGSGCPQEPARQLGIPSSSPAATLGHAGPAPPGDADAASEPATMAAGHEAPDNELSALERTVARHADARARLRALQAIYTTADRPTVLANLVRALSDSSPVIRRTAVTCLGLMAAWEALPELCSVAGDPDVSVREAYARALASCGGDAAVQLHLRPASSRHIPISHSTLACRRQAPQRSRWAAARSSLSLILAAVGKWGKWAANQARRRAKRLRAERTY